MMNDEFARLDVRQAATVAAEARYSNRFYWFLTLRLMNIKPT